MTSKLHEARGFSLIEMTVVILLLGIVAAFTVPAYVKFNRSLQLKGAVANLASQLQLARAKAMATGNPQRMIFEAGGFGFDYRVHEGLAVNPYAGWSLPKNVTYVWTGVTIPGTPPQVSMTADGRATPSGKVILQALNGLRDTVDIQLSGLVLMQ